MKRLTLTAAALIVGYLGATAVASQRTASSMANAANKWLASLSADQKQRATFAFDSEERLRWHFVPNEQFPRKGVQFKEMSEAQRALSHELLKTGLSARGYLAATSIVGLEDVLKAMEGENRRFPRDILFRCQVFCCHPGRHRLAGRFDRTPGRSDLPLCAGAGG